MDSRIVGQRWEVYNFASGIIKGRVPKKGEIIVITNTPQLKSVGLHLVGDGEKTVAQLYEYWDARYTSPEELAEAIRIHNEDPASHPAIHVRIDEEITERKAADQVLQNAINTEANARAVADQELLNIISGISTNRIVGWVIPLLFQPSPYQLAQWRLLPLKGQIIEIALYQELVDRIWVGAQLNATALWLYKCNSDGTRNTDGLFFQMIDGRGLFIRGAGANSMVFPSVNALYDGGNIGTHLGDTMRYIYGEFGLYAAGGGLMYVSGQLGPFFYTKKVPANSVTSAPSADEKYSAVGFNVARVVPTSHEFRSASVSVFPAISY